MVMRYEVPVIDVYLARALPDPHNRLEKPGPSEAR